MSLEEATSKIIKELGFSEKKLNANLSKLQKDFSQEFEQCFTNSIDKIKTVNGLQFFSFKVFVLKQFFDDTLKKYIRAAAFLLKNVCELDENESENILSKAIEK